MNSTSQTEAPRLQPPIPPTEDERKSYYYGLCSSSILVARSGTTPWEPPSGPEAYHSPKELRVVGDHKIAQVWEGDLALKVEIILDEKHVQWTSMDVVRIGYADESSAPVVLWLGVKPDSLSPEDGILVVAQCQELLATYAILDVDVEIRESDVFLLAGSPLLAPGTDDDLTAEVRQPLTATLGMSICAKDSPWAEGTGGFFIRASSNIYLVTARHVVLPPRDINANNVFQCKTPSDSEAARNVLIFSEPTFQDFLSSIQKKVDGQQAIVDYQAKRIMQMGDGDIARRQAARDLSTAKEAKAKALADFRQEVSAQWGPEKNRIIGEVVYAPPLLFGAGSQEYTQDLAIIAIDPLKIDLDTFAGNVIDLGFTYPPDKLTPLMSDDFDYPVDRLLRLCGTSALKDGITVLKRGRSTGLTIGRANNLVSYARHGQRRSKEWAILPYNKSSGAFSAPGDSGAVIVDGAGRAGGLLTGGAGSAPCIDITYATPMTFVMETIRACETVSQAVFLAGPIPKE